jgi:DNA-binding HxlR family transcriptional regulator
MDTMEFDRWGRAMSGGYQVIPNQLFRQQQRLRLSSHQVVILLNLAMHWWRPKDLPFISPHKIAKRMGVSRRTVERQLKKLCDMGYVERKRVDDEQGVDSPKVRYDLSGLIRKLESKPIEIKSTTLQRRIDALEIT